MSLVCKFYIIIALNIVRCDDINESYIKHAPLFFSLLPDHNTVVVSRILDAGWSVKAKPKITHDISTVLNPHIPGASGTYMCKQTYYKVTKQVSVQYLCCTYMIAGIKIPMYGKAKWRWCTKIYCG